MPGLLDDVGKNLGGLFGNLGAGAQNFLSSEGLGPAIANAITGATTGQRTDPLGYMQQMQQQAFQTLVANGVPKERALLAIQSPEAFKAEIAKLNPTYAPHNVGNTTGSFSPQTGQFNPQFTAPEFKTAEPGAQVYSYQPPLPGQAPMRAPIQASPMGPPGGGAGPMPLPPGGGPGPMPPAPGGGLQAAPMAPPAGGAGPMQLPGTQLLSPGMSPQQLAAQRAAGEAQGKAAAALPNTLQSMDLAIGTLDKIINHPAKNDWFASGASALIPPFPGTEARNYVDTVNQFKNQLFEMGAATMRGLGSLSNAEGKKITDAAANIDLRQSPARIAQSMQEAKNVLQAARANAKSVATGSGEYTSPIAPKPETSQQQDTGWTQIAPNIRVRPKQ